MPPGKQAIDGLWHCLCPTFAAQPLTQYLPLRHSRRFPAQWHVTVQRPAHRNVIGRSCRRSAAEAPLLRKRPGQAHSIRSIHVSGSGTLADKHWNGTFLHDLTNHDAYEALRKASTTGSYEMVQALIGLLVRERQEAPSPQLYLALLLANANPQNGSLEEVFRLLQEMEESGIVLDSAMYHAVLKVRIQFVACSLVSMLTGAPTRSLLCIPVTPFAARSSTSCSIRGGSRSRTTAGMM